MVKWLFFDVGNVLVVDELHNAALWTVLLESARVHHPDITLQTLMAERERLVLKREDPTPFDTQGRDFLGNDGWEKAKNPVREQFRDRWMDLNVPVPGWAACLESLKGRFHLGIAANQPSTCRQHLQQLHLLKYFDIVGISDDLGLSKPHAPFFHALLSEAGCEPDEAAMIGDRIDNDIAPAQHLSLKTIQVSYPPAEWWFPVQTEVTAAYLESLKIAPARGRSPTNTDVQADAVVHSVDQFTEALDQLV
jgi:HAD superfamily hydrolase (TIGR01509 family)